MQKHKSYSHKADKLINLKPGIQSISNDQLVVFERVGRSLNAEVL